MSGLIKVIGIHESNIKSSSFNLNVIGWYHTVLVLTGPVWVQYVTILTSIANLGPETIPYLTMFVLFDISNSL